MSHSQDNDTSRLRKSDKHKKKSNKDEDDFPCLRLTVLFFVMLAVCLLYALRDDINAKMRHPRHQETLKRLEISMPNIRPLNNESYLCTVLKLDEGRKKYVVAFTPNAQPMRAHHVSLHACATPFRESGEWNCGVMAGAKVIQPGLPIGDICSSGQQVLYVCPHTGSPLRLPEGVAFEIGGEDTDAKYLVLQVHYADVSVFHDKGDTTGVILSYTENPQPRLASVLKLRTETGFIPSNSITYWENYCRLEEDKTIHVFMFRVHTHKLGTLVEGFLVKPSSNANANETWALIGKDDPQRSQEWQPLDDRNLIVAGKDDIIAGRCQMTNHRDRATSYGPTIQDEMCDFYIMYWIQQQETSQTLTKKICRIPGPPEYSWQKPQDNGYIFKNVPKYPTELIAAM